MREKRSGGAPMLSLRERSPLRRSAASSDSPLSYERVVGALQRAGWVVVRRRGSRIRVQKHTVQATLELTAPARRPIRHSALAQQRANARVSAVKGAVHLKRV